MRVQAVAVEGLAAEGFLGGGEGRGYVVGPVHFDGGLAEATKKGI